MEKDSERTPFDRAGASEIETDEGKEKAGRSSRSKADDLHGPSSLPPILTADELATYLRVNRKTLYEAAKNGEIPGTIRIGRVFRFHRDQVLKWSGQSAVIPTERKGR